MNSSDGLMTTTKMINAPLLNDIGEFNPSITEKAEDEALKRAKEYILILEDKINITKHCPKSLLYHNEDLWIKKGVSSNFDNHMGSFDGVYLSEFIGYPPTINSITDSCNNGFYRDDGLIIVDDCTPRKGDIIKKELHWLFNKFRFKFDIQTNFKIMDYLDVTFNLYNGTESLLGKKQPILMLY